MKLYEFASNASSRRVGIFLKELGIEIESVQLDVRAGENLTEEYKQKSINGKVPMLELDDGTCISETVAICRYLAEVNGNMSLFGHNAVSNAKIEMWHRIVEFEGLYTSFQAFRNISGVYSDRERCVKEWGVESKLRCEEFLSTLNAQLAKNEFVAGGSFSIVDITAFLFINVCKNALEIDVFGQHQDIKRWFDQVSARPAFQ